MKRFILSFLAALAKIALTCLFFVLTAAVLCLFVMESKGAQTATQAGATSHAIAERYNMFITNTLSEALDGVLAIKKVYWLNDDDLVAPEPNQSCFGTAKEPSEVLWLLDEAAELLDGQDTLFSADTPVWKDGTIHYYLDETILVIAWKEVWDDAVYNICEVKIADPSQFRRFLADGVYASGSKYVPTELARSVNAVLASNGDFYTFRNEGIIVYDGQLMRAKGWSMDSCLITGAGDMLMLHKRQVTEAAEMEALIQEHGVRFSISFGPILIENGEKVEIKHPYPVGEGDIGYNRAALCQRDTLHYYLVTACKEAPYESGTTLWQFQNVLDTLGCKSAYNLDGGQSATLIMNDKTINKVWQRQVSDIIYFATAIPDGE